MECNAPVLGVSFTDSSIPNYSNKEELFMKQLKRRVLSVLVLAAILVPMIALVAFAGSPK